MPERFRLLARYNAWMNTRLFDAAARLDDAARRRDRGAFFKSIHGTLNHILVGDSLWMSRFEARPFPWTGFDQEMAADFAALREARMAMDARITAFVAALAPEQLVAPFDYVTTAGQPVRLPAATALTHFFNHQTHHRGQVTTLLFQAGIDPGDTDLVAMPDMAAA